MTSPLLNKAEKARVALITGIAGQDGHYLRTYLEALDYRVIGIDRARDSAPSDPTVVQLDLTDFDAVAELIAKEHPDEVYNLAALHRTEHQAQKASVFAMVENNMGVVINLLEAIRQSSPQTRFFQAGSSEIFGNCADADGKQRLTTPMRPETLYGYTKLMAHTTACHYRTAHNIYTSTGFLYNHESPLREARFVTTKVVKTAVEIKKGIKNALELGNIDSGRDWGHAADYVRAMWLTLQQSTARDWIIGTGTVWSIREMCDYVFTQLGLDYREYVTTNPSYNRTEYIAPPCGDITETLTELKWSRDNTFYMMLDEMIDYWNNEVTK